MYYRGLFLLFLMTGLLGGIAAQDLWQPTSNLISGEAYIPALAAGDGGTVVATVWGSGVFRSADRGSSWTRTGLNGQLVYDLTVTPRNHYLAFATHNSGYRIYRSTDDGLTWNQVYSATHTNNWFNGGEAVFLGQDTIVAIASFTLGPTLGDIGVDVLRSVDGGASWQLLSLQASWGIGNSLCLLKNGTILAGTSHSGILQSANKGVSWQSLSSWPPGMGYISLIRRNSKGHIFVCHNNAAANREMIFRSIDGGASWQTTGMPGGGNGGEVEAMYIDPQDRIYAGVIKYGPREMAIYASQNDGVSWEFFNDGIPTDTIVYALNGNRTGEVYAGTGGAGVYWHGTATTGLPGDPPAAYPAAFELAQNYPNPFNPETRISFVLRESASINLSIYAITGEKVAVLANGLFPAGRHDLAFVGRDLPSGIYFYRLSAPGGTLSKK
nr:T9SS type A sorting domain-containing protein [Calditrichia bacterium]